MLDVAFSATKWIVDNLIQKNSKNKDIQREKWVQVANYLENIAKLIDESIDYLKNDEIPFGSFAQLQKIHQGFEKVLSQVYDNEKEADIIHEYKSNLAKALHLFYLMDVAHAVIHSKGMEIRDDNTLINLDGFGEGIYPTLSVTAGEFRGAASTIRALA
jgi:alanine-alpha-ketoisovalerate/valine-pyruvate aminotransferase